MSVTPTLPPTLSPTSAAATANTVAEATPDQATGFAGILRAAGNRAAGAGADVGNDSAAAEVENASELLVANTAADALASVEMIAPWIVPLLPMGAAAAQAPADVGGTVADAGAEAQVAAMQVTPRSNAARTVALTAAPSVSASTPDARAPGLAAGGSNNLTAPDSVLAGENMPPVLAAAAALPGLAQTPASGTDAATGKVAVGRDPGLPPPADRTAHAPPVQADLRPATAATVPGMSSAFAEADRANRDASAARAEATPALSPASIGSATPPAMREAPTIMQAVDSIVASPGWQEDVARKLTHFVSLRATTAEIRLNPADLGPIGVTISYTDDQARIMITAAQPATRDALEQALPHLKEMLAEQGITLGEAEVRDRRESMPQWADADPRRGYSDRRDDAPGARADAAANSALAAKRTTRLIDTFA